jgi:hypothetical protein
MTMAEAGQHRGARRRGFIPAFQRFPGFEQGKAFRRVHAERFEHLGREHFANAALQRQPAVGVPAVGRLARSFCPKVEQPITIVAQLREGEATPVANLRIVHAKLVPVVPKRERLREIVRQRFEPAEVCDPFVVPEVEPDPLGPAPVEEARRALRETGRLYGIVEVGPESQELGIGPAGCHRAPKVEMRNGFR